jgi:hypothetical protein
MIKQRLGDNLILMIPETVEDQTAIANNPELDSSFGDRMHAAERGKAKFADTEEGHWVTVHGAHVFIGEGDRITKGPLHMLGKRPLDLAVAARVEQMRPIYDKAFADVKQTVGHMGELTGRLKTPDSLAGKLEARSIELNQVRDIAGLRLICPNIESQDRAIAALRQKYGENIDVDDKREKPGIVSYRAVHVELNVDGQPVELQIHTQRQEHFAMWEHDAIYKGPLGKNPEVLHYAERVSDSLYAIDRGRPAALPDCPPPVSALGGCYQ